MTKTLTPEGAEKIAAHGWVNAAWHKLPMIWGYSATLYDRSVGESVAAGDNILALSTPPAGEVWVVTNIAALDLDTAITSIVFAVRVGTTDYYICAKSDPAAGEVLSLASQVVLSSADQLRAYFDGCTAGDNLYLWGSGYKMKVAE